LTAKVRKRVGKGEKDTKGRLAENVDFKGIGEHRECYENPVRRFGTQRPQVQILSTRP